MAASSIASSEADFRFYVKELGLDSMWAYMDEQGWTTYADFAFSVGVGEASGAFETTIVPQMINMEIPAEKKLLPRLRRLYTKAFTIANAANTDDHVGHDPHSRVHLTPADRTDRLEKLKQKITGFSLKAQNMPSTQLTDKCVTILVRGVVKYIGWDQCTSKEQEMLSETETKGLRVLPDGRLAQDLPDDLTVNVKGELLWDYALRRRAVAADLAGLANFSALDDWTETMKLYLMKEPPTGHKKVTFLQLLEADRELWHQVSVACEAGTKADPTRPELNGRTAFEHAFRAAMFAPEVRTVLMFLQGSSVGSSTPSSSSAPSKPDKQFAHQLRMLSEQNQSLKRKLDGAAGNDWPKQTKGNGKGKKEKGKKRNEPSTPRAWGPGVPGTLANGDRICYGFNLSSGCALSKAGKKCHNGYHVCPLCPDAEPAHSILNCPKRSS